MDLLGRGFKAWEKREIYRYRRIRSKLAETIAVEFLHAILTSKYPPKILATEFFDNMTKENKEFLERHWNTFDLFKPVFKIVNEVPVYSSFVLYEVKSKVILEKNKSELIAPEFQFTFNQKKFFEECLSNGIQIKIFAVYLLDNWEIDVKELDYSEVKKTFVRTSSWYEEKIKRIRSSKLNQFFNELYPEYVLYKVDEERLEEKDNLDLVAYTSQMAKNPDEKYKSILDERKAKLKNRIFHRVHRTKIDQITRRPPVELLKYSSNRVNKENTSVHSDSSVHTYAEVRIKYPSAYAKWTSEEDHKLEREFKSGQPLKEIAQIHGRKLGAISSRLIKLGLVEKR